MRKLIRSSVSLGMASLAGVAGLAGLLAGAGPRTAGNPRNAHMKREIIRVEPLSTDLGEVEGADIGRDTPRRHGLRHRRASLRPGDRRDLRRAHRAPGRTCLGAYERPSTSRRGTPYRWQFLRRTPATTASRPIPTAPPTSPTKRLRRSPSTARDGRVTPGGRPRRASRRT
jgi:hypothetical protein